MGVGVTTFGAFARGSYVSCIGKKAGKLKLLAIKQSIITQP